MNKIILYLFGSLCCLMLLGCERDEQTAQGDGESVELDKSIHYGDYRFQLHNEYENTLLYCFLNEREILHCKGSSSYFDTIYQYNLNNDNIPDFILEDKGCEGSTIYALLSNKDSTLSVKHVTDYMEIEICLSSHDSIYDTKIIDIQDVNSDGYSEILINHIVVKGKLTAIDCSDTISVKLLNDELEHLDASEIN